MPHLTWYGAIVRCFPVYLEKSVPVEMFAAALNYELIEDRAPQTDELLMDTYRPLTLLTNEYVRRLC